MRTALPLLLTLAALAPSPRAQVQEDVFATRSERHHLVVGKVLRVTFEETPPHTIDGNAHDPVVLVRSFSCGLETADFAVEWSSSGLPDKLMLEHTLGEWCTPAFDWKADRMLLVLDAEGKVRASSIVLDGIAPLVSEFTQDHLSNIDPNLRLPIVELDHALIFDGLEVSEFPQWISLEERLDSWPLDNAVLCRTSYPPEGESDVVTEYDVAFTKGVDVKALWPSLRKREGILPTYCSPYAANEGAKVEIIDPR